LSYIQNTNELVSVIIPCYNEENYIYECLESVISQTYKNIEIICVNDGSTDNTREILYELRKNNSIIQIIDINNSGAPVARNIGLNLAKGTYIQFLDADDLIRPNKIEHQFNLVKNVKFVPDMVAADWTMVKQSNIIKKIHLERKDPWIALASSRLGNTVSNFYKRSTLLCIGGWDESISNSQDADLIMRLLMHNVNIIYDTENLTIIRKKENSISTSSISEKLKGRIRVRAKMVNYLEEIGELTELRERVLLYEIFSGIDLLFQYDKELSLHYWTKYLWKDFEPPNKSKIYKVLYNLIGYKYTKIIQNLWGNILKYIK